MTGRGPVTRVPQLMKDEQWVQTEEPDFSDSGAYVLSRASCLGEW